MSTSGIIVEYNPLHNGHVYHINKTKYITGCDNIIAVMSGNFVQRGEPAILNKWARTKAALLSGIDIVIELPVIYAVSSAESFAFGAVSILNSLGIVDSICFGSESGDIDKLYSIADILCKEPDFYKELLKENLKSGLSFPSARQNALTNYIIDNNGNDVNHKYIEEITGNPNNILAVEYLKSLIRLKSNIRPYTIQRIANSYNQREITGKISSATSIRNNFNDRDIISRTLPEYTYEIIMNEELNGRAPVTPESLSDIILYKLRLESTDYISSLLDVSEGLEYKIKKAAEDAGNINELIEMVKSKRYTSTRIRRILTYALLNITKKTALQKTKSPAEYIRILGVNSKGRDLLKEIKNKCPLPIITNPSQRDSKLLELDIKATDIYVLGYKNPEYKSAKQDLKIPPVII